jgi:PTS system beta-glucosides-specific IIC component
MIISIVVTLACVVAGFLSELIFYKDDAPSKKEVKVEGSSQAETLVAPINGELKQLSDIADAAFSSGAMGKGIAIAPAEGKVYAPADGTITAFFATGHAIGITTDKGAEIIIHVGMDTVKLEGKGFEPKVKQGDTVKKGDLLLEFDIDYITSEGYSVDTPVIITNTPKYDDVIPTDAASVAVGDTLITLL